MAVTIKQIAEIAGVSAGTVDRALNNRGRVNPQVAEKIRIIAKELNYQPNTIAKSLSIRRKKMRIAVILHVEQNIFVDNILEGISKASSELKDAGFNISVKKCKDFDAEYQLSLINKAVEEKADGIILIPINNEIIKNKINELHKKDFPVVLLTSIIEDTEFLTYVGCNYKYSGQIACGIINLLTGGKANLAVIVPNLQMWSNNLRLQSIKKYMEKHYPGISIHKTVEVSNDEIDSYIQIKSMLEKNPEIDAIIYSSGAVSGGLRAIVELNQNKKYKLITFDFTEAVKEGLQSGNIIFTIIQNPEEQGYKSVKILADYLINKVIPQKFSYVNTEIIIKESIKDFEKSSMYLQNR